MFPLNKQFHFPIHRSTYELEPQPETLHILIQQNCQLFISKHHPHWVPNKSKEENLVTSTQTKAKKKT
jgi:hypothetical protein